MNGTLRHEAHKGSKTSACPSLRVHADRIVPTKPLLLPGVVRLGASPEESGNRTSRGRAPAGICRRPRPLSYPDLLGHHRHGALRPPSAPRECGHPDSFFSLSRHLPGTLCLGLLAHWKIL